MSNRLKTFHLSTQQVAHAFDHAGPPHVNVVGLPAGYKVEGTAWDHQQGTVQFTVSHDSFPEVKDGETPEELQVNLSLAE